MMIMMLLCFLSMNEIMTYTYVRGFSFSAPASSHPTSTTENKTYAVPGTVAKLYYR